MGCMSSKLMFGRSLSCSMGGRHRHRHLSSRDNNEDYNCDHRDDDRFTLALLSAVHKLSSSKEDTTTTTHDDDATSSSSSTLMSQQQPLPEGSSDGTTQAEPEETIINAWELMDGLDDDYNKLGSNEESVEEETAVGGGRGYRRSKSCGGQKLGTSDGDAAQVTIHDQEEEDDGRRMKKVRCRSFHTVEEYDALLERIFAAGKTDMEAACDQYNPPSPPPPPPPPRVDADADADADNNSAQTDDTTISSSSSKAWAQLGGGWKRKNMREELAGSLIIPPAAAAAAATTIEFTTTTEEEEASLRQWLHPQASNCYETPKFGSYHPQYYHDKQEEKLLIVERKEEDEEEEERNNKMIIIIRELVATFEECMLLEQQQPPSIIPLSDSSN